jgi:hypothetical protein
MAGKLKPLKVARIVTPGKYPDGAGRYLILAGPTSRNWSTEAPASSGAFCISGLRAEDFGIVPCLIDRPGELCSSFFFFANWAVLSIFFILLTSLVCIKAQFTGLL